jgi:branched-chain amino acid transport system substrate-binding protein
MSVTKAQTPIKIGILFDLMLPPGGETWNFKRDLLESISLTVDDAVTAGKLDRPVELILKEVEGLPRGAVRPVIEGYKSLVESGCVLVLGPLITDNAPSLREYIEREGRVPAIAQCATDEWLGEWTFNLCNGSLTDEPYVLASVIAKAGHKRIAVVMERSLIGRSYVNFFHHACEVEHLSITGIEGIPQTDADITPQLTALKATNPDALVHWGFGFGSTRINETLKKLQWNPKKYMGTSWEIGFLDKGIQNSLIGWIGLEQYDEENSVTTAFLDRFEAKYGRRPEYFAPGYGHDIGNILVRALSDAEPLSPTGIKDALERVKMLPAASGADGTRISFGKWKHMGWMGASYLVAREFDAKDLSKTHFRGRVSSPRK